ncbi:HalX domain-containing protein [Halovivax cerinus]|uniref:HalX domain-containing protein n=1 Tax=Halovivax cerinus TaxID=1487865 RepID=A0ABD5NRC1_9EURY|nr:HalX domain-containing protein [Halovivax cerinus]
MTDTDPPVVAIVEDEPAVAESYELWLGDDYEIVRAHDGAEALDVIDESVDVVLLDRMMPERSGEEVLQEIRARGIDCRVAMVTAVEPDFDVVEMGFDAYITKPPERSDLLDTVETLLDRASVDDEFQEYHSLMARRGALEAEKSEAELADSEEYQDLLDRIDVTQTAVDDGLGDMSSEIDFVSAVRDLSDDATAQPEDGDGSEWDENQENV